ncbi:hypothetical protein GH714_005017 [Hevea brasiliensis]|uniref:Uncharacterized protein n=1 Tax=Hevea brasiliensis TaxID=3981 RepID=A0A6A6MYZ4_HEVBR|nr:hypothetical protein GH714_005017 [Hevea brasiliensis]
MTKSGRYYPDPPMEKDNVRGKAKKTHNCTDQGPECTQGLHGDNSRRDCQSCAYKRWGHITFSDHDIPAEGRNHSRALFVIAEVGGWKVPCVMIDDRAYDDLKRNVIGVFKTMVKVGPIETEVEFTVLDIPMTFSLLLGRIGSIP